MTKALEFLNLDKVYKLKDNALQNWVENIINKNNSTKDEIEKEWNLYFYRASKAIMKRSYRILRKEEIKEGKLSVEQANELDKAFIKFCKECGVDEELIELKTYLVEHKEKEIKENEIGELEELINKLG